jgi:hypothetical protein
MALVVTLITLLTAVLGLVAYDVYLAVRWGYEATISYQLLQASRAEPIIPLALGLVLGILLGHLFWPQGQP